MERIVKLKKVLSDPGKKLMILNRVFFVAGIVISLICGFKVMFKGIPEPTYYDPYTGEIILDYHKSFFGGIGIIAAGAFISWFSALMLESYAGFVVAVNEIRDKVCGDERDDLLDFDEEALKKAMFDIKSKMSGIRKVLPQDETPAEEQTAVNSDETRKAMVEYYKKIPTVGEITANKFYDAFGSNLGMAVREGSEKFAELHISDKTMKELQKFFFGVNE